MLKPSRLLPAVAAAVLCLAVATKARAQTEDVLPPPPTEYEPVVPELVKKDLEFLSHWATLHLGAAPILDYTSLTQDQASVGQVGFQENALDIRSARIFARGTVFAHSSHAPRFFVAFEYRGFDSDPDHNWNFTDVTMTFPLGRIGDLSASTTTGSRRTRRSRTAGRPSPPASRASRGSRRPVGGTCTSGRRSAATPPTRGSCASRAVRSRT